VILADQSEDALRKAKAAAAGVQGKVSIWKVDLETPGENPLQEEAYSAILVFRYLHRPLMPCIRKALRTRGFLLYSPTPWTRHSLENRATLTSCSTRELMDWFRDGRSSIALKALRRIPASRRRDRLPEA